MDFDPGNLIPLLTGFCLAATVFVFAGRPKPARVNPPPLPVQDPDPRPLYWRD